LNCRDGSRLCESGWPECGECGEAAHRRAHTCRCFGGLGPSSGAGRPSRGWWMKRAAEGNVSRVSGACLDLRRPDQRHNVTRNGHGTQRVTLTTLRGFNVTSEFRAAEPVTLTTLRGANVTGDRGSALLVTL
jgi:hypothetical protein